MYAKQVFWEAVSALATDTGSIQDRLAAAAGSNGPGLIKIAFHVDEQLPEEYRDEFRAIWGELLKEGTTIAATTHTMTDAQARKLAERIFNLFVGIMGGLA